MKPIFGRKCVICGDEVSPEKRAGTLTCSRACGRKLATKNYFASRKGEIVEKRDRKRYSDEKSYLLSRLRERCARNGIEFDLCVDDFTLHEVCPVLGIPMGKSSDGKRGYHDGSYSFDRKDPSKGYVKGNVEVISLRANRIKYNATSNELRLVLAYVEECEK